MSIFSSGDTPFYPHSFTPRIRYLPGSEPEVPKVILTREAYARMFLYVQIARQEVGWLGTVKQLPNGDFRIEKVMLLKQEVTGVETELSNDGLGELAMELLSRGDEGVEDWNNMRFWGHSHVHMHTSPSGTDEHTMLKFQNAGHPWFIRGIFNKDGRAEFTIFLYEQGLKIEDARWEVEEAPIVEAVALNEDPARQAKADETATQEAEPVQEIDVVVVAPDDVAEPPEAQPAEVSIELNKFTAEEIESEIALRGGELSAEERTRAEAFEELFAEYTNDELAEELRKRGHRVKVESGTQTAESRSDEFNQYVQAARGDHARTDERSQQSSERTQKSGYATYPYYSYSLRGSPRYTPEITPALRSAVKAEFMEKVKTRTTWFTSPPRVVEVNSGTKPQEGKEKTSESGSTGTTSGATEAKSNAVEVAAREKQTERYVPAHDGHCTGMEDLVVHDMEGIDGNMGTGSRSGYNNRPSAPTCGNPYHAMYGAQNCPICSSTSIVPEWLKKGVKSLVSGLGSLFRDLVNPAPSPTAKPNPEPNKDDKDAKEKREDEKSERSQGTEPEDDSKSKGPRGPRY